jgi:hypothetical protein
MFGKRTVDSILRQKMVVDSNWLFGEAGIPLQLVGRPQKSLVERLQSYFHATLAYRRGPLNIVSILSISRTEGALVAVFWSQGLGRAFVFH